jgi:uncharacterized protein (DUF433 family)
VSSSTVRAWVFGTSYGPADAQRRFKPVVIAASPRDRTLSFTNLVEIHILTALRREHGVTLPKIRSAITFLGRELGVTHPLARAEMQTDGTDIFIERLGRLLSASQDGQAVMREAVEARLERVRYEQGAAVRLFPLTRAAPVPSPATVAIDPRHHFGRPYLASCGIETEAVTNLHLGGDSIADIAHEFGASEAEIEEALRYEHLRERAA